MKEAANPPMTAACLLVSAGRISFQRRCFSEIFSLVKTLLNQMKQTTAIPRTMLDKVEERVSQARNTVQQSSDWDPAFESRLKDLLLLIALRDRLCSLGQDAIRPLG